MVRSLLLSLTIALLPLAARADLEERTAKNTVYLELGGNGLIYSVNYERFLSRDLNVRVGLEYFSLNASSGSASGNATLAIFPVTVSFLGLSKGPHAFELGAGLDIVYASASTDSTGGSSFGSGTTIAGTAILGYRYAPRDGGFNFRFALTPIFNGNGFAPWFGIAVGFGI